MCDFCEREKIIFKKDIITPNALYMCGPEYLVKVRNLSDFESIMGLFIDQRGYLRFVDLEDCNCLDSGEKIEISYCPFCGNKINQNC